MTAAIEAPPIRERKHADVATRRVALAGNPNCGKTTLFNALAGMRQKIGNYPGVTVEKKTGRFHGSHGEVFELLDLPGTYSLQGRSPDEIITCDVLLGRRADTPRPDVIVVVLDASNLERNLYLAAQIAELGTPMIVALNMVDLAENRGALIDVEALATALGTPVVPCIAPAKVGLIELKQALSRALLKAPERCAPMPAVIEAAAQLIAAELTALHPERVAATRATALLFIGGGEAEADIAPRIHEIQVEIRAAGLDPLSAPVEARYAWAQTIVEKCARRLDAPHTLSWSDWLDAVLTHRLWGWLSFVAVLGAMFFAIFTLARFPMDWLDAGTGALGGLIANAIPAGDLRSLLVDGVIAGVGSVVIFLPQILVLFLFIGLLEDTGYMARAAFIMDRLMSRVGLHGKSFIPLLSSFACAIPGIMATRTIEQRKDRLATIFIAPLMSCSARLPVYALMIAVLFPSEKVSSFAKAGVMLAMYLTGIGAAFATAWLFKKTLLRGETPMLLLELPPYRAPKMKSVLLHMWQRGAVFLKQAGTVILALSIVLWALARYPKPANGDATPAKALSYSIVGRVGHGLEPLIKPLGYDWKIGIGLVSSFAARETFVSTMAIIHNLDADAADQKNLVSLREAVRAETWPDGRPVFTPSVCVGLMVFYVLALQCLSTVAVVRRETNSWRWPLFQLAYMTALAYGAAFVVYRIAEWSRLWKWEHAMIAAIVSGAAIYLFRKLRKRPDCAAACGCRASRTDPLAKAKQAGMVGEGNRIFASRSQAVETP
jgi:ferrous iron transport protein B